MAIELAVPGFVPIAVSERALRPAVIALRKSSVRAGPGAGPCSFERIADLSLDLRLAENERVEPGGHAGEVSRDVVARVEIQVVDEHRSLDAVRVRESVDQGTSRVVDALGEQRVELDAVARRQHDVLDDLWTAVRAEPERAKPLAQLHGRGAMAETEADEALHPRTLY